MFAKSFSDILKAHNPVDIEDTALNNYGLAKSMDFGYIYNLNKKWTKELKDPVIEQIKYLVFSTHYC